MATNAFQRITAVIKYLLLGASAFYIVIFLYIALSRINYPFELEWTEGACVMQIQQILSGAKLFSPPTVQFIPYAYTPLYFYVSAAVGAVTGVGYLPLRLVSFICALGCFLLIYRMVRRSTGSSFAAFLSCGLFAASYRYVGAWYDIGRPDMLFLLLLLAAAYTARFKPGIAGHIMVGVFTCLAYLTKQHAPLFIAPLFLYLLIQNWRRGLIAISATAGAIILSILLLDYYYDGWFTYYIFEIPRDYATGYWVKERIVSFWTVDFLPHILIAFVFGIFYFIVKASAKMKTWDKDALFYLLFSSGMILTSWLVRIPEGSYTNALIPAYTAVAIMFGIAIDAILRQGESLIGSDVSRRTSLVLLICLLGIGQFFELRYKIDKQIPSRADRQAGTALVERLAKTPGNVYVPWHSYIAHSAGKELYANQSALNVIFLSHSRPALRQKLIDDMRQLLRKHYFNMIVLDEKKFFPELQSEIDRYYVEAPPVFTGPDGFWPVTGANWRPQFAYIPRSDTVLGSTR